MEDEREILMCIYHIPNVCYYRYNVSNSILVSPEQLFLL